MTDIRVGSVTIDISEDDCRMFDREVVYKGQTIEWEFPLDGRKGETILIRFIPYSDEGMNYDGESDYD